MTWILLIICVVLTCAFFYNRAIARENVVELRSLKEQVHLARNDKAELEAYYKEKLVTWQHANTKSIRTATLDRSRAVMRGQATEHLAPLMIEEWALKDFRFIGNPIDYIVFAGLSNVSDGEADTIDQVIFLDIKTNTSTLSKVQRRIRDAIKEGKVIFATYNPDDKGLKKW